ncbi:MAG: hypothetical protein ABJG47_18590 [Ekhidna sp.]
MNRKILIPISNQELYNSRKGILGLLRRVELDECDERLKEDLKSVFGLLNLLFVFDPNQP